MASVWQQPWWREGAIIRQRSWVYLYLLYIDINNIRRQPKRLNIQSFWETTHMIGIIEGAYGNFHSFIINRLLNTASSLKLGCLSEKISITGCRLF